MCLRPQVRVLLVVLSLVFFSRMTIAQQETPFLGEINANNINVRSDATINAKVICTLNKGEQAEVISEFYEWYKIRLPNRISVYLKKNLADCIKYGVSEVPFVPAEICLSAKVLRNRVNVRTLPEESSTIVGVVDKNEIVNVRGEAGGWYKIEPIQDSFAWVHKKFIDKASPKKIKSPIDPKTTKLEENNLILRGVVKPYGIVFRRKATHKLVTDEGKVYLLKGNKISLNALTNQKVKVIGKEISPAGAKIPVIEIKIVEVAS